MDLDDLLVVILAGGFIVMLALIVNLATEAHSTTNARRAICEGSDGVLVEGTHCLILPNNNLIDLRGRQND